MESTEVQNNRTLCESVEKVTQDKIILSDVVFYGFHGVNKAEKQAGQRFIIDLEVEYDLKSASTSDKLESTVDYSSLYNIVKQVVEGPSLNLIETVAEQISSKVLDSFPVESVLVRVKKPEAPIKGSILGYAAAEIVRHRDLVLK